MKWIIKHLPEYWKAVAGAAPLVLFVGQELIQAISNGGADGTLSVDDIYKIISAGVAAYLVFKLKNRPQVVVPPGE